MQRIRQLDGIRAIAILSVFMHHALHVKMLWMGVDLFFVLSGFLITGVLIDAKHRSLSGFFAHFYSRRARRILPPYLLTLVIVSLLFGVAWMKYWYFYVLLTNFLLALQIPRPEAFDPLWSLAVEEQFYLVWPFAVYFLDSRRLKQLCIVLIIAAPLLRGLLHFHAHWTVYTLTPFRMDLLAGGGLLCLEWRERRETIHRWGPVMGPMFIAVGVAGLLILAKLGYTTYGNSRLGNVFIYEACLFVALGCMVFALGGWGIRLLCWGPMIYIGRISYSMYLIHLALILLVSRWLHGPVMAIVALALTIFYAAISWHLMENRLLRGKHPQTVRSMEPVHSGLNDES